MPPSAVAQPALALRAVSQVFAGRRGRQVIAVDRLSLEVAPGEVFGLLGPNGSGKTTTINMICGLVPVSSGSVSILGMDRSRRRDQDAIRRALGVVPQETALYNELTAKANMRFHADLYGVPREQREKRIADLLELVSLAGRADSRVATFSGGMRRRLAIARALLHEPQLLILDEPTLGVDVQARAAIWEYIAGLRAAGKTILVTTNQLDEAQLCDRLAIIDHGRLVTVDTPQRLRREHGGSLITVRVQATQASASRAATDLYLLGGVRDVSAEPAQPSGPGAGHVLQVATQGETSLADVVACVSASCRILDIGIREVSLDQVFLSLTGSALRD
jgi:ABC-2 type transport system ATP-binding protein